MLQTTAVSRKQRTAKERPRVKGTESSRLRTVKFSACSRGASCAGARIAVLPITEAIDETGGGLWAVVSILNSDFDGRTVIIGNVLRERHTVVVRAVWAQDLRLSGSEKHGMPAYVNYTEGTTSPAGAAQRLSINL